LPLWLLRLLCITAPIEAFGVIKLNFIDLRRNYKSVEDKKEETPFERFKRIATQVVSVPRAEIQKRELQWKNGRKQHKSHKRHR
jgi:hypothetical protein